MMRNVIEHSEATSFHYCAQYWPSKDWVEIGFVDSGIGLRRSLDMNPRLTNINDHNALNLAITPGISKTVYGKGGPKGYWHNSGFGLYMVSRLCGEGGNFCLVSGSSGIVKTANQVQYLATNLPGTGVRINLRPSMLKHLNGSLEQYRKDAESIAEKLNSKSIGLSPSMILKRNHTDW